MVDPNAQAALAVVVTVGTPGGGRENAGVLLADPSSGRLLLRFRRDLADLDPDNADILEELPADLEAKAREFGPVALLDWLESNASNFVGVTDRETVAATQPEDALGWIYHRNVRPPVRRFQTHLPRYSLQAAAGKWGPERDVESEPEEWVEAPETLRRLNPDMFVARVTGRSMEPLIPDGSLCVFQAGAALGGSRNGKRVLVANYGEPGDQRFTVKRYESVKVQAADGRMEQTRIILHPLNPEFDSWEIPAESFEFEGSGRIRVVGEFVCVLGPD